MRGEWKFVGLVRALARQEVTEDKKWQEWEVGLMRTVADCGPEGARGEEGGRFSHPEPWMRMGHKRREQGSIKQASSKANQQTGKPRSRPDQTDAAEFSAVREQGVSRSSGHRTYCIVCLEG